MRSQRGDAPWAAIATAFVAGIASASFYFRSETALAGQHAKPATAQGTPPTEVTVDADGAVHLPPMTVPFSIFASPEAKAAFLETNIWASNESAATP
jgi:hypothetical protein